MISKTNQAYLDMLKEIAVNGEVHKTLPQLADYLCLSESGARNVLTILMYNDELELIKKGRFIAGVRLNG